MNSRETFLQMYSPLFDAICKGIQTAIFEQNLHEGCTIKLAFQTKLDANDFDDGGKLPLEYIAARINMDVKLVSQKPNSMK